MGTIPKLNIKGGEGDVQALNRWADAVTTEFADQKTQIHATAQKTTVVTEAVAALPPPAGDGLIHGDKIWETDPAYVILRDDFVPYFNTTQFAATNALIGELGWNLLGTPSLAVQQGGIPPYIGQLAWQNPGTVSYYGVLVLNTLESSGSTTNYLGSMALLEK